MKKASRGEAVRRSYTDAEGIPRVVLVPPGESDASTGIPVSLDLSSVFAHLPPEYSARLHTSLHEQGLIEAADYFKPGADQRFKAALLSVIRTDFLSVQTFIKQEQNND